MTAKELKQKGWQTDVKPVQEEWYWVTSGDGECWLAKCDRTSAGGWNNEDTWEDFDESIIAWKHVEKPK